METEGPKVAEAEFPQNLPVSFRVHTVLTHNLLPPYSIARTKNGKNSTVP